MNEPQKSSPSVDEWYKKIDELVTRPIQLMEVCGTHTVAISRFGLRSRLPKQLKLLSGPGCPVCVTPTSVIDALIALCRLPNITIATFGDMLRVPGSVSSLQEERATGKQILVTYSPLEALDFAKAHPEHIVVFAGVGFETTLPVLAATIIRAREQQLANFFVVMSGRLAPPAMMTLLESNDVRIDGFICPGHVSSVIGSKPYEPIASKYRVPCVITGFEAKDILEGVYLLVEQIEQQRASVEIQYKRAVPEAGNPQALAAMERVFRVCDAAWRGIGLMPNSGMELNDEFSAFDALKRFGITLPEANAMPTGCQCGEVMRGIKTPPECPLFGNGCTPARPVGPCMVSTEGSCAAYYRYGSGE
ncbi:MAG: hydrogenase formation protein HypD [bacterium]|nr:hydrogenase formation protein HypD [bacterium]